jgi:IS605 OrfB family transposase
MEGTWKEFGDVLHDISYATFSASNYVMRENYLNTIAKLNGESTEKCYCYPKLIQMFPNIAPRTINAIERMSKSTWNQYSKDVIKSKISLPTFKQGTPIPFHNRQYKVINDNNNYIIDAQLRSNKFEQTRYKFIVAANDGSTIVILKRIISGEYTQGEAELFKRKKDWYFVIPYKFEAQYYDISKDNIMGIDLGITKAAYWAFNNSHKRGSISGNEITQFRNKVRARRVSIQHQGKYSGRTGHGRDRMLLPTDTLSDRESNFRDTCNHRYARYIVDQALKMRCGIIQMEDLKGISTDSKFLNNWTYFDLQTKITNKAQEYGIEVRKVNPEYTSQRCSNCGHIEKDNRKSQATFICNHCGYGSLHHCFNCGNKQEEASECTKCGSQTKHLSINADYNAARNLATDGIAEIIANYNNA